MSCDLLKSLTNLVNASPCGPVIACQKVNSTFSPSALDEDETYASYLEENPQYQAATEELSYGTSSETFVGYGEFRNQVVAAMEEIAVNGADPQEVLDNLQAEVESILADNL